ncbi:MAG: hypothetical protein JNM38_05195 [Acidobacteria bacterium]|jgi:hypothetical protein|nr:hypothetical protein [Acidobacteriota bacterium]
MSAGLAVRRSNRVVLVVALLAAGVVGTWFDEARLQRRRQAVHDRNLRLAGDLRLTDVCLFGDAPWLRHLSQSDVFASMQDGPGAFDYSRSGSLVGPRGTVTDSDASVAEPPALSR